MSLERVKPRFRAGLAIGIEELKEKSSLSKELMTEALMIPGYIGYVDAETPKVRVYAFKDDANRDKMLKIAKELNFRTVGSIKDVVFISNENLNRPHMKYVSKESFYKELYK